MGSSIALAVPDTHETEQLGGALLAQARGLVVRDVETHTAALEFIARCKRVEQNVRHLFTDPKKAAHQAHRSICDTESKLLRPFIEARGIANRSAGTWHDEQERLAEEEQKRLRAAAKDQEELRLLNEAAAAEEDGDHEAAAAILQEAEELPAEAVPVVQVAPAVAKVAGVSRPKRYSAEVSDLAALVRHVAGVEKLAREELLGLLSANGPALNGYARAMRDGLRLPGVRLVVTRDYAGRGR